MPYEDRVTEGPVLTGIIPYDLFPYMTFKTGPMTESGSIEGCRHMYWKPLVVVPPKLGSSIEQDIANLAIGYHQAEFNMKEDFLNKRDEILRKHGVKWPVPRGKWDI